MSDLVIFLLVVGGIASALIAPFVKLYFDLKKRNKMLDEPCTKYQRIKARRKLRSDIFEALVNEKYHVNHLSWYIFELPDGSSYTMGIVEVLGAFGDDIFRKVEREQKRRKSVKQKEVQYSYVEGLQ